MAQLSLFGGPKPPKDRLPAGLVYRRDFLAAEEEVALAEHLAAFPLAPFEFHGFFGRRRVVSFGWRYAFDGSGLAPAAAIPDALLPLRARAARFAGLAPCDLEHVLVTEYAPGAGIGWHRDRSVFGDTIGISLLGPCRLRFRRRAEARWERAALIAEPRSIYLLRGEVRSDWEHSIPPVEDLRYSVMFRSLAEPFSAPPPSAPGPSPAGP